MKTKTYPSLNDKVVKKMSKEELIKLHPDADEDYLSKEYDRIQGKVLRKVTQEWLDKNPTIKDVKIGDMYPM